MSRAGMIGERFAGEVGQHEMTVVRDDGLYRHLRFRKTYWKVPYRNVQRSGMWWFDLITVPGTLIFQGDGQSFVFSRVEDMFTFFRGKVGSINPHYWGEKITSGREGLTRYSEALFRAQAGRCLAEAAEHGGVPPGVDRAWRDHCLGYDLAAESEANRAAVEFRYKSQGDSFEFHDSWEWDTHEDDWWFLWACHAIVWGIDFYDTGTRPTAPEPVTPAPAPVAAPPASTPSGHVAGDKRGPRPPSTIVTVGLPS